MAVWEVEALPQRHFTFSHLEMESEKRVVAVASILEDRFHPFGSLPSWFCLPLLFYGTSIRRKYDDISPAGTSAWLFDATATGYKTRDEGDKHTEAFCEENNGSEFG